MNSIQKLMELNEKGLLSDDDLAIAIKDLNKENVKEKTVEEKRNELIEKTRQHKEYLKEKKEKIMAKGSMEVQYLYDREWLLNLRNRIFDFKEGKFIDGELVYTKEELDKLSYFELMSLADEKKSQKKRQEDYENSLIKTEEEKVAEVKEVAKELSEDKTIEKSTKEKLSDLLKDFNEEKITQEEYFEKVAELKATRQEENLDSNKDLVVEDSVENKVDEKVEKEPEKSKDDVIDLNATLVSEEVVEDDTNERDKAISQIADNLSAINMLNTEEQNEVEIEKKAVDKEPVKPNQEVTSNPKIEKNEVDAKKGALDALNNINVDKEPEKPHRVKSIINKIKNSKFVESTRNRIKKVSAFIDKVYDRVLTLGIATNSINEYGLVETHYNIPQNGGRSL